MEAFLENAAELPTNDRNIRRSGNCYVTVVNLEDISFGLEPQEQKPRQKKRKKKKVGAAAVRLAESAEGAERSLRQDVQPSASALHESTEEKERANLPTEGSLRTPLAGLPTGWFADLNADSGSRADAFAAAKAKGKHAIVTMLQFDSEESLTESVQALRKLLSAVSIMFLSATPGAADIARTALVTQQENTRSRTAPAGQDVDSLRARSTGLMPGIPAPAGSHLRFKDGADEVPLCRNLQRTPGSMSIADSDITPAAAAVAEDVAQHTIGLSIPAGPSVIGKSPQRSVLNSGALQPGARESAQKALQIAVDLVAAGEPLADETSPLPVPAEVRGKEQSTALGSAAAESDVARGAKRSFNALDVSGTLTTYSMMKQANLGKYWTQRYSLWSLFDFGVLMDLEGWYSATPEALARHHARRLACHVAVDAFCGVAGNAVQLAATCSQVIATDINLERLILAKHNAGVYGVANRIDFVCGDFLRMAPHFQADTVFLSPPWGGPSYNAAQGSYDIQEDIGGLGINYQQLLSLASSALHLPLTQQRSSGQCDAREAGKDSCAESPRPRENVIKGNKGVACFLPKATSIPQLSAAIPEGSVCEVERNILNGRLKSVTVYHGQCCDPELSC